MPMRAKIPCLGTNAGKGLPIIGRIANCSGKLLPLCRRDDRRQQE